MADKYIDLKGEEFELRELSKRFQSAEIRISGSPGHYVLRSKEFADLNSHDDIRKRGESLLAKINGAMKLVIEDFQPIGIQAIATVEDNGKITKSVVFTLRVLPNPDITAEASGERIRRDIPSESTNAPVLWVKLASKDGSVGIVLSFLGLDPDWNNLYKILEVIEGDQGGSIPQKEWASRRSIRLFKHTANSYHAVGGMARHANDTHTPPPRPMSLVSAKRLIMSIVREWLDEKIAKGS